MKLACPICKQLTNSETNPEFPFCSARCRERDLGNWATEQYKVALHSMDESEAETNDTDVQPQVHPLGNDGAGHDDE